MKARPRRIAIGKDDTVWYGDYARGYLGHLDPKTGKVEEFKGIAGQISAFLAKARKAKPCPPA